MDFTETEDIACLLIFIDFQKAFDSLECNFLFDCLNVFNFGPDIKHWFKTFLQEHQKLRDKQ